MVNAFGLCMSGHSCSLKEECNMLAACSAKGVTSTVA